MATKKKVVITKKVVKKAEELSKEPELISVPENIPDEEGIQDIKTNHTDMDNYVIEQYRSATVVNEFLLRNAYYAMKSTRAETIFEPYPESWKNDITTKKFTIKDIIEFKEINKNIETVLLAIRESYNDSELIDKLEYNTYELVRFIIKSNTMMIKADNLLTSNDIINIPLNELSIENTVKMSEDELTKYRKDIILSILQFKLIHTQMVEDRFKDNKTLYLYHGSIYENWYSIMRNGIKIGSKSKYFLNGAAHGNGVYLSNNINMSLGYSKGNGSVMFSNNNSQSYSERQLILAIFEVVENPKWVKGNNIFVVDDENALILRYLLVFNDTNNPILNGIFQAINIKLNTGGIQQLEKQKKEMETKSITTIHNKRLMREYQMIMKQEPDKLGFKVELAEETNLSRWMILITNPENDKLMKQMVKLGIKAIEIEITFKDTYPIAPPFIRVVYPHFKFRSGHITVGGSLCMEMLTNQGWSPTFNVENVITQIKLAISEGEGEIDEVNFRKRYTMDEAVHAFKRVLETHNWV